MAAKIKLVTGDTLPKITFQFSDDQTGLPVDLSDASAVKMKFREANATTLIGTIIGAITSAATGMVQFQFTAGMLNVEAGLYEAEFEITHANGDVLTVYDIQKFTLREQF